MYTYTDRGIEFNFFGKISVHLVIFDFLRLNMTNNFHLVSIFLYLWVTYSLLTFIKNLNHKVSNAKCYLIMPFNLFIFQVSVVKKYKNSVSGDF